MSDETSEAKPSQPVGDTVRSAKDSSSPEEEDTVSVELARDIKVGKPLKLIISRKDNAE
jgi:hypothetical protein